jgi:gliding motility-associated-like protein
MNKTLLLIILMIGVARLSAQPYFNLNLQCAGSPSTLSLTNTAGIDSVKWLYGNGFSSPIILNQPFTNTYTYNNAGSFTLSVVYYTSGLATQKDTTIVIYGIPTPYLYDFEQCYQQLTYNVFQNGCTYLWSTGATSSSITVTTSGVYWVKSTNQCGTGIDTGIVNFIYPPGPTIPAQIDLCGDTTITIIAGPESNSYLWQDGSTNNSFTITGPMQIFVYESNQCGGIYEFSTVTYYAIPYLDLGPDTVLCGQNSYELKATFKPATTVWYDGTSDTVKVITQPGTYYVMVSNFCKVLRDTVVIDFQQAPVLDLGNDTLICGGQSVEWYVYNYGATYNWSNGATGAWNGTYQPGKYWVTVENACGIASDTIEIKMRFIYVNIPVSDTEICVTDYYPVNVAVDSTTNYLWSDGNTNSYRNLTKSGIYYVTVSNECGVVSDTIRIRNFDCNDCAKYPSGFTPNGDGKNDIFRVLTDCDIRDYKLNIYNRNGQLIFSSFDKNTGWDGTFNGIPQPIGVYVFTVSYNFWDGDSLVESSKQGNITLIR